MSARALITAFVAAALLAGGVPSSARAGVAGGPGVLAAAGGVTLLTGGVPVAALTAAVPLADARGAVADLDARRARVAGDHARLEDELDTLAAEIVELKSRRRLFGDAELNRKLQTSRELSARIDRLGREAERLTAELLVAARRLAEGYDSLVAETRREIDALGDAEEDARRTRLERLAALEAERRAVHDGLARLERGGLETDEILPGLALAGRVGRDDPEELRAQADIVRDTRDRLQRRLDEVDRKAKNIREQRALEREMDGFLAETRLFDEGDRSAVRFGSGERPVGARSPDAGLTADTEAAPRDGGGDAEADAEPSAGFDDSLDSSEPGAPPPEDGGGDALGPSPDGSRESFEGPASGGETLFQLDRITTRAEASAALDALLSYDGGASLEDLEAHRAEIERLIRRLDRRAEGLERRADALDRRR